MMAALAIPGLLKVAKAGMPAISKLFTNGGSKASGGAAPGAGGIPGLGASVAERVAGKMATALSKGAKKRQVQRGGTAKRVADRRKRAPQKKLAKIGSGSLSATDMIRLARAFGNRRVTRRYE